MNSRRWNLRTDVTPTQSTLEGLTVALVRPQGPEMFRVLVRRFSWRDCSLRLGVTY